MHWLNKILIHRYLHIKPLKDYRILEDVPNIERWNSLITHLKQESKNAAWGWFDTNGTLLSANDAMRVFLGVPENQKEPEYQFINPRFQKLQDLEYKKDELIFEGLLTIGNYRDVSFVVDAKIYRIKDVIFVFAEADALNLFEENRQMSRLNQEVNNLQRQLLKEKKKLEKTLKELRETQQMLIQSEKMNALGQMVAGIAHEINNPIAFVTNNLYELEKTSLNYIEAFGELENSYRSEQSDKAEKVIKSIIKKYEIDYLTEDIKDILSDSRSGVERVKKIIEDLRRFSRLDESDIKHINLTDSIKSILSITKSEFEKKKINFTLHSADDLMADCFPGQLNQAILNILINAIHASDNNGEIKLSTEKTANKIIITIQDYGTGISEKDLNKIFNPFFTTKPVGSGTGLGLSITYKIVTDLHKGQIEVESKEGEGSKFKIIIPATINSVH